MLALISGQVGIALSLEGDVVWCVTVERPQEWASISPGAMLHLLQDADDIKQLKVASREVIVAHLEREWRNDRALRLTLMLLDREDDLETRSTYAECIEEFFKHDSVREFVENRLHRAPLPGITDLIGARRCASTASASRVMSFLDRLASNQVGIANARRASTGSLGEHTFPAELNSNMKVRGNWGEVQLGNLLEQLLTPDQYGKNIAVTGEGRDCVEFAIKLPGKGDDEHPVWLPIDAKFPQSDYQRLVEASELADVEAVESAAKALSENVWDAAKTIRDKYIHAPQTTDFGILFLPTEGLYAEVLRRPGLADKMQRELRIIIAGPTTLTALLHSLQMGFHALAIQKPSGEVSKLLGAVKGDFEKFSITLKSVKVKFDSASSSIEFSAPAPLAPQFAAQLSQTEQQILHMLIEGMTEKEIAQKLGRSGHTTHVHVRNIYRKASVSSRRELKAYFARLNESGIAQPRN